MAKMTTILTEFADNGNSRTMTAPTHTVFRPRLVIQKRKLPANIDSVSENSVRFVFGTVDTHGAAVPSKVSLESVVRVPANGQQTDIDAAVALYREFVASDNFVAMIVSSNWIQ